jgi:hypothetical protein
MRLCGVSSFSSTTFLPTTEKLLTTYNTCNPHFPLSNSTHKSASFLPQLLRSFRVVLNGRRTIATLLLPRKPFVKYIFIYLLLPRFHCTIDSPPLVVLGTGRNAWP